MRLPSPRPSYFIAHRPCFSIRVIPVAFAHHHLTKVAPYVRVLITRLGLSRAVGPSLPVTRRQQLPFTPLHQIHLITTRWTILSPECG